MTTRASRTRLTAIGLAIAVAACGSNPKPQVAKPAPAPAVKTPQPPPTQPPPPPPPVDPVNALIQTSQKHFEAGERELKMGHLDRARTEFDRAVDVLLELPYGARSDARMREHFDRLVDRINAYEVGALAQGDGFAEKKSEPASIDEILKIATFARADAGKATEDNVKADLAATAHDIPIAQNDRVMSAVELLQTRLHDYVQDSLTRGAKYLPMIQNVFKAEGLPLDLAYIPIIESGFKTNALSKASARGPWQFMRATANDHGLKSDWYVDERSDPEKSTVAAAKYLKTLHGMFGDWNLVLAAYNGGLGRVQRAMKQTGKTDFWSLTESTRHLPRETREYVPLILAAIIVAKNPAQYGFEFVQQNPFQYETVTVSRAIDLRRVAEWTDTSIDEIQSLNPELRRLTTPVRTPNYDVRVPVGTANKFQAQFASASPAELTALKWYTVKRGESLLSIARKNRVKSADLAAANGLSARARVSPGQSLVIPGAPATLIATRTTRAVPPVVAVARPEPEPAKANDKPEPAAGKAVGRDAVRASVPSPIVYRVKRGDTLFSIARLYNTTVAKIKSWNRIRGNAISPGDRLRIHRAAD